MTALISNDITFWADTHIFSYLMSHLYNCEITVYVVQMEWTLISEYDDEHFMRCICGLFFFFILKFLLPILAMEKY